MTPRGGNSRLFAAAAAWDAAAVKSLLRADPQLAAARDPRGRTALHLCSKVALKAGASAAASLATAKALLDAGGDVNAVQPIRDGAQLFPARALWFALVIARNRPLGALLLRRGADPNDCVFGLVYADDVEGLRLVHRNGSRLDDRHDGETPLIYAARHRRTRCIGWLLRAGADVRAVDSRGFTALHHAVRRRLPDGTLRALVRHGADPRGVPGERASIASLATRAQRAVLGIAPTALLVMLSIALGTAEVHADAFRCGSSIVSESNSLAEITARCGTPRKARSLTEDIRRPLPGGGTQVVGQTTTEEWLFDRGRSAPPFVVTVVDGKVRSVRIAPAGTR